MKKAAENTILIAMLVVLSAVLYYVHFTIFRDANHIFIYLLGDIAFMPLEILFVTLIFHKLLEDREKKNTLKKINMIIGVFLTQVGTHLIKFLETFDPGLDELRSSMLFNTSWGKKDFRNAITAIGRHTFNIDFTDVSELKMLLQENREFMMKTMENPTLLEHELFSETITAIFHLEEELSSRADITHLQGSDKEHIKGDIARVYKVLVKEWILYNQHLKSEYPYLFSFAVRTNPFDKNARVEIT